MIDLQRMFDEAMDKSIDQIKQYLIQNKFRDLGITLTKKQLKKVVAQSERGTFTLDLEDVQLEGSPFAEQISKNGVQLEIPDTEIQEITCQFSSALEQAIPECVQEGS